MTKLVDLPRVRRARARLDEIAREHPQAFAADRLPGSWEELQAVLEHDSKRKRMGRPSAEDPAVALTARLPRSMIEALDQVLGARRQKRPELTRQDLLREAVGRFLMAERRRGTLR